MARTGARCPPEAPTGPAKRPFGIPWWEPAARNRVLHPGQLWREGLAEGRRQGRDVQPRRAVDRAHGTSQAGFEDLPDLGPGGHLGASSPARRAWRRCPRPGWRTGRNRCLSRRQKSRQVPHPWQPLRFDGPLFLGEAAGENRAPVRGTEAHTLVHGFGLRGSDDARVQNFPGSRATLICRKRSTRSP